MRNLVIVSVALFALVLTSCASTAGPYVTNISYDGGSNVTVEKCMVRYDPWMATVNNTECHATQLHMRAAGKE